MKTLNNSILVNFVCVKNAFGFEVDADNEISYEFLVGGNRHVGTLIVDKTDIREMIDGKTFAIHTNCVGLFPMLLDCCR